MKYIYLFAVIALSACSSTKYTSIKSLTAEERLKIKVATPLDITPPKYPSKALKNGVEGSVEFLFDVNKDGYAENFRLLESYPEGVFEEYAFAAMKKWRFETKYENETPVLQRDMKYTLDFKVEN